MRKRTPNRRSTQPEGISHCRAVNRSRLRFDVGATREHRGRP
jgi:hypothetical protein